MKYAWIRDHRDSYPIAAMCRVLQVSKAGYYAWRDRPPSPRAERTARIQQAVRRVHTDSHGIFGSVKITKMLAQSPDRERACRNTVAKAMRELGLKGVVPQPFKPITTAVDPSHKAAPNTLAQNFSADAPNRKWVTDITYLKTAAGWVYLAVVLDLFSRKVVGWHLGASLATELVATALRNAIESRRPTGKELLHHSDRGCQYTSEAYQRMLQSLGIECSMSRTGCCYDNAVMERFFWSLKHEWTNHHEFADEAAARLSVFKYIETFYNSERLHQSLNYLTPNQFEAINAPTSAA
ncbi:MAG: IS3 family transposase [Planctomycetales bacterium]|nr:IS3 family transposase [Planctomycetales bacterium]